MESDDPQAWHSASFQVEGPSTRAATPEVKHDKEHPSSPLQPHRAAVGLEHVANAQHTRSMASPSTLSGVSFERAMPEQAQPVFLGSSVTSCTFQLGEVLPPPPPAGQEATVCWLAPLAGQWGPEPMQPVRLPDSAL